MLQNRMNELDSAILDIMENKVYITGFTREEMLQVHLNKGTECWSSKGLYNYQDLEFHNIKDNALIIVRRDGEEINRYQYKPIYKNTIESKNEKGNIVYRTFIIRKSSYSKHYHFQFVVDKESEVFSGKDQSLVFPSKEELNQYLSGKYGFLIPINL